MIRKYQLTTDIALLYTDPPETLHHQVSPTYGSEATIQSAIGLPKRDLFHIIYIIALVISKCLLGARTNKQQMSLATLGDLKAIGANHEILLETYFSVSSINDPDWLYRGIMSTDKTTLYYCN